jgi:hypothetical protein
VARLLRAQGTTPQYEEQEQLGNRDERSRELRGRNPRQEVRGVVETHTRLLPGSRRSQSGARSCTRSVRSCLTSFRPSFLTRREAQLAAGERLRRSDLRRQRTRVSRHAPRGIDFQPSTLQFPGRAESEDRRLPVEAALPVRRQASPHSDDPARAHLASSMERLWSIASLAGASRGKSSRVENGMNKPNSLPLVATSCRGNGMVRRGSTVRVRQRALQERRASALFCSDRRAPGRTCGGLEPFMELSGSTHTPSASSEPCGTSASTGS